MKYVKFIFFPFALLYGIIILIRNLFYDTRLLRSFEFDIPLIAFGNLNVGGTGKTPFIEYMIRLFEGQINTALLSRGYKRHTRGYLLAGPDTKLNDIGDEPFQVKKKFPHIPVVVCVQRVLGIPRLVSEIPKLETILLDDAFQHRSIKPGLSVLLTGHDNLFTSDYLLPVGNLREWRSAYKRANIMIITKCPNDITDAEKKKIIAEIKPNEGQSVFFSFIRYGKLNSLLNSQEEIELSKGLDVVLMCGIADPSHIRDYIKEKTGRVNLVRFNDHHSYNVDDLTKMKYQFEKMRSGKKILVITDKDVGKLEKFANFFTEHRIPVYSLPMEVDFIRTPAGVDASELKKDEEEKLRFEHIVYDSIRRYNYHP